MCRTSRRHEKHITKQKQRCKGHVKANSPHRAKQTILQKNSRKELLKIVQKEKRDNGTRSDPAFATNPGAMTQTCHYPKKLTRRAKAVDHKHASLLFNIKKIQPFKNDHTDIPRSQGHKPVSKQNYIQATTDRRNLWLSGWMRTRRHASSRSMEIIQADLLTARRTEWWDSIRNESEE